MRSKVVVVVLLGLVGLPLHEASAQRGGRGGPGHAPAVGRGPTPGGAMNGSRPIVDPVVSPRGFTPPNPVSRPGSRPVSPALNTPAARVSDRASTLAENRTAGKPAPFSPAWYANHPQAWHTTHPYAGPAATTATVAAFLAVPAAPAAGVSGGTANVVVQTPPAEPAAGAENGAAEPAADVPPAGAADSETWMELGQYAVGPNHAESTRRLHLAVNPAGVLRGTHYDMVSDEAQAIAGTVSKSTRTAAWQVGQAGVAFQCPLDELLKAEGRVQVAFPDGRRTEWTLTRSTQ